MRREYWSFYITESGNSRNVILLFSFVKPALFREFNRTGRYQNGTRPAGIGGKSVAGDNITGNNGNQKQDGGEVYSCEYDTEIPWEQGKECDAIESKQPFASRVKGLLNNEKRTVSDSFFLQKMPSFSFEITGLMLFGVK